MAIKVVFLYEYQLYFNIVFDVTLSVYVYSQIQQ